MTGEAPQAPWEGVTVEWMATGFSHGHGCAAQLRVAPGYGYPDAPWRDIETVVYVCEGSGLHLHDSGGSTPLERDDVLTAPVGVAHGFANDGDTDALLLITYASVAEIPWHGGGESVTPPDGQVGLTRMHTVDDDPTAVPERGFREMRVSFDAARGARLTTAGSGRWPGGHGRHAWHRHRRADEVIYIYEGTALHMTDAGTVKLSAGDLAWVPAEAWHSMASAEEGADLDAIFLYLGAATLEDSGYEPRDAEITA